MANLYQGTPDERQGGDGVAVSRFRPVYRALSDEEKALHDAIKAKASELETLFEQAREMRTPKLEPVTLGEQDDGGFVYGVTLDLGTDYFGQGMTALKLAVMWTVKGLTA
jgi:hypothetical protein